MTFPASVGQVPIYYNALNTGRPQQQRGQLWTSGYLDSSKDPAYPFGYGLSYTTFEYKKGVTTIETDIDELWKLRAGVCQDFAHLLLYMMRLQDIPCRYVSGYICPGSSEWRGEGATHAWVEAWLPDLGWVGIDPTNKCMAGERHVRLAVGRSFTDCTPVKGTYKGSLEHLLEVSVQFSTQPFTEEELKLKPFTPEQQMRFNKGVFETYDAYLQRQQQQQ